MFKLLLAKPLSPRTSFVSYEALTPRSTSSLIISGLGINEEKQFEASSFLLDNLEGIVLKRAHTAPKNLT